MRDEIIAGLRIAIERGESLDVAIQSFINAGYNPEEVNAAAKIIYSGASTITQQQDTREIASGSRAQQNSFESIRAPSPEEKVVRNAPDLNQSGQERGSGGRTAIIISIILSLLIFLGAIGYLIYLLLVR